MALSNFSRISGAVDVPLLKETHIVCVGAGGAYCLCESFARTGLGKLTVLDFDHVEEVNITRQGYETDDIGRNKVDALGDHLSRINTGLAYRGITHNFLDMDDAELDEVFGTGDVFLFLTDSFKAQAFGNKLALCYQKPAIWAGYYEKSRCAEIIFIIPGVTPACFRCAVSARYAAQAASAEEIAVAGGYNMIFHSQVLDAFVGMLTMAILHNEVPGHEFSNWFGTHWDRNLIQFKTSPQYGNMPGSLFKRVFEPSGNACFTFNSIWQRIEAERPPKYTFCPDCGGTGNLCNGIA